MAPPTITNSVTSTNTWTTYIISIDFMGIFVWIVQLCFKCMLTTELGWGGPAARAISGPLFLSYRQFVHYLQQPIVSLCSKAISCVSINNRSIIDKGYRKIITATGMLVSKDIVPIFMQNILFFLRQDYFCEHWKRGVSIGSMRIVGTFWEFTKFRITQDKVRLKKLNFYKGWLSFLIELFRQAHGKGSLLATIQEI